MSVGGILQNSLSQPSYYLDMKLHRWGFISPGSHCLLMIIQIGGNLHAVMLLTTFLDSSPHLLYNIYEAFFRLYIQNILEVKFFGVCTCATSLVSYYNHSKMKDWGSAYKVWGYCTLSNQGDLIRGRSNITNDGYVHYKNLSTFLKNQFANLQAFISLAERK